MAEMLSVTPKIFFDRKTVVDAVGRKNARVLSQTGAFARTVMKRGMRKRKKVSDPGEFPSSHAGHLRNLIFFGYDAAKKSVVIGPTLFKDKVGGKTIPQLINEGGNAAIDVTDRKTGKKTRRSVTYRPRPFVALTAKVAIPKFRENMAKIPLK